MGENRRARRDSVSDDNHHCVILLQRRRGKPEQIKPGDRSCYPGRPRPHHRPPQRCGKTHHEAGKQLMPP